MKRHIVLCTVLLAHSLASAISPKQETNKSAPLLLKAGVVFAVGYFFGMFPASFHLASHDANPCTQAELQKGWDECGIICDTLFESREQIDANFQKRVKDRVLIGALYRLNTIQTGIRCDSYNPIYEYNQRYQNPEILEKASIASYCSLRRDLPAGAPAVLSKEDFEYEASWCFAQNGEDSIYHWIPEDQRPGILDSITRYFSSTRTEDDMPELVQE